MSENHSIHEGNTPKVHLPYEEQIGELQQLYDRAPCGYHSLDASGLYVRINDTELMMLGYERKEIIAPQTQPSSPDCCHERVSH